MTTAITLSPAISMELHAIDAILRRLERMQRIYPTRARELAPRIDSALDERLRLMRLRDGRNLFTNTKDGQTLN